MTLDYFLTFIVGLIAGATGAFVGGGGGLLSVSFLILLGFPPHVAVATNRFAAVGASASAFVRFVKSDKIVWPLVPFFIGLGILGGIVGAKLLINADEDFLTAFAGGAMICLAPLLFINKHFGTVQKPTPFWSQRFILGCLLYFILMVLGGFFGPGIGILFVLSIVHLFGLTIIQAIATQNLPWSMMSLTALVVLALEGMVDWLTGLFLFIGMAIGGWYGADNAIRFGDRVVKVVFALVCIVLGTVMLLKE